jgi:ribose/xylose/arabinose/galactoside ABC-type transport system permease subunit
MPAPPPVPAGPVAPRAGGSRLHHLIWEAALLLLTVGTAVVLYAQNGLHVLPLSYSIASTGLLATAFALSLRTATPNLAIVGVGSLAGLSYGEALGAGAPLLAAAVIALGVAVLIGLGMGLVTGLLQVPAWAVSLGGLALAQGLTSAIANGGPQRLPREGLIRSGGAVTGWLVLFLLMSIGGALLWSVPAVRTAFGANRVGAGEPASSFGARLLGAIVGLGGSSLIAGAAGILLAGRLGGATGAVDLGQLALVVGAVLLGGVRVLGGRGGFAGTVLGVVLLCLVQLNIVIAGGPRWLPMIIFAMAILAGTCVSRAMEVLRPTTPARPVGPLQDTGQGLQPFDTAGLRGTR